jgi:fructose-1,6-bisphosphatase/inositol monophosphatase family enzyme
MTAANKAKEITLHYFWQEHIIADEKEQHDITSKHYKSPATIADKLTETAIKDIIKKSFPDHWFLGEEEWSEWESDFVWIIDPIDWTKSYMRWMDDWAILIALQYKKEIVLWISLMPLVGELVYAVQWMGCFCNEKKCSLSTRWLEDAYIAHERYKYFRMEWMETKLATLRWECAYYIANKTPRQFHYLLQWKIDCIVWPTGLYLYDIAPYSVMIKEAWWVFTTLNNTEVVDERTSFVACNHVLHERVLAIFSK